MDASVAEMLRTHRFLFQEISAGNAVLFCGAGVSQARYPTWSQLVERLAAGAGLPADDCDYLDLPQWYVEARGRQALEQALVHIFDAPAEPTPLLRLLARFPWDVIFTTNYDQLLEKALYEQGRQVDVVVEDTQVGRVTERSRTTLVKMHGCVSRPHSLVVTREDYDAYDLRHPATITYLQSLLSMRTFLFVGFSLRDPNFRNIYRIVQQGLGSFRRYAYALLLEESSNEYLLQYWRRQRLLILPLANPTLVQRFLAEALDTATRWATRQWHLPAILQGLGPDCGELAAGVQALAQAANEACDRIRLPLLPQIRERGDEVDSGRPGALEWSRTSAEERQQLYSLHNLLQLMEEIGIAIPARRWLHLGNTLYELGKWDLAVQAYQRVHRRMAQGGWDEAMMHPKEIAGDLARCYLSLAQERLDAFRHISGDRSVVLDLAEYEWAESHLSRCILSGAGDLDRPWLARRPSDLSEHSYANNRMAEIEMARGQADLARQRLEQAIACQEQGEDLYQRARGNLAWAFALNHLGKSHRLCVEIAVAEGRIDSASHHFAQARRALLEAVEVRSDLGYPFGHLFDLFRLVEEKGLAGSLGVCLDEERAILSRRIDAVNTARGQEQQAWLQDHYPEVWKSASVV